MTGENSAHRLAIDCIYEALVRLMEIKPYKEITITDITNKAGVSRMAYYRNYQDKDDILINHLREEMEKAASEFLRDKNPSHEEFWRRIIFSIVEDPINEHVVKAGLLDKTFESMLAYAMRIYREAFGLDLSDEQVMMMIYSKVGGLFGYMVYMIDRKDTMDMEAFAKGLGKLLESGMPFVEKPCITSYTEDEQTISREADHL